MHNLLSASQREPVRLSDLAGRITRAAFQGVIRDRRIVVPVSSSAVPVPSDQAHRVVLMIIELASNCPKYALGKRDAVEIAIHIDQDGDRARLEFRDDGPVLSRGGIAAGAVRGGDGLDSECWAR